ncbi:unnamed protein product [Rhizophagus irregularis]|nr:unnamed protein product [Rhizophagus irregularis]
MCLVVLSPKYCFHKYPFVLLHFDLHSSGPIDPDLCQTLGRSILNRQFPYHNYHKLSERFVHHKHIVVSTR